VRLVREVTMNYKNDARWTAYAREAIQTALEAFLVDLFFRAGMIAKSASPSGELKVVMVRHVRTAACMMSAEYSHTYKSYVLPRAIEETNCKYNPLPTKNLETGETMHSILGARAAPEFVANFDKKGISGKTGLSAGAISRIAYAGACRTISTESHPEVRAIAVLFLELAVKDSVILMEHSRRKTITVGDVIIGAKKYHTELYGFGYVASGGNSANSHEMAREKRELVAKLESANARLATAAEAATAAEVAVAADVQVSSSSSSSASSSSSSPDVAKAAEEVSKAAEEANAAQAALDAFLTRATKSRTEEEQEAQDEADADAEEADEDADDNIAAAASTGAAAAAVAADE